MQHAKAHGSTEHTITMQRPGHGTVEHLGIQAGFDFLRCDWLYFVGHVFIAD